VKPAAALKKYFGHSSFRGRQEEVVQSLLAGHSTLALFPTGAGKSLCYQLPALLLDGLTIVVSPLIALMKDQVETLKARGIAAARLDSSLPPAEVARVQIQLAAGQLRLLYVAPERFASERFAETLARLPVALLAIDEAHCISQWGHNFRPDYLRLAGTAKALGIQRVLCLTATATPEVARDICESFGIAPEHRIQTSFHRQNLHFHVTPVSLGDRQGRLLAALREPGRLPAIVYVTRQETAEEIATFLQRAGLPARAYHAGLPDDQRAEAQDLFMSGSCSIMVATIAFGMGVDKADIRAVMHYNLPKSPENLLQETGRAGRDGWPAHCELLACGDDLTVLRNFICGGTPGPQAITAAVNAILRQGQECEVSVYDLSQATDSRPHVTETILACLESDDHIVAAGSFHGRCRVRFLRPRHQVMAGRDPLERRLLETILECAETGRQWLTIDLPAAGETIGLGVSQMQMYLNLLSHDNDAVVQFSHRRLRYRINSPPQPVMETAAAIAAVFHRREAHELAQLDAVVSWARETGCLTRALLAHFGESLSADCGHCGNCHGWPASSAALPVSPPGEISADDVAIMQSLIAERRAALRSARQLARFLCGISSPASTRSRLSRHDHYGRLANIPFPDVLAHGLTLLPE
jgi:ATP-dependent DNA helicase RecQ